jgi:ketosteroid isomerase-like protein
MGAHKTLPSRIVTSTSSGTHAEVLAANQGFYDAFSQGDLAAMGDVWAKQNPVVCFHPGMQLLSGRAAVMRSWSTILAHPPELPLRCLAPRVELLGETAIVTCYEGAAGHPAHLAATNVFVREQGSWKMVHHHASPIQKPVMPKATGSMLN